MLTTLTVVGCRSKSREKASETKPLSVKTIQPERKALTRAIEQPGVLMAEEHAKLIARVPGYVGKLHVDIGTPVKKGQILIELHAPELEEDVRLKAAAQRQAEAEVLQMTAALRSAKARGAEVKAGLARAKAQLERWKSEEARVRELVKRGVLDAQTRDETSNQLRSAEATFEEVQAQILSAEAAVAKAEADVDAARARGEVASADARRAKTLADYTRLVAPFDGVITERHVHAGDLVGSANAAPLLRIARINRLRAAFEVPESEATLIREGQSVSLQLTAAGTITAKVSRTAHALADASRTLRVEADVDNAAGKYRPGMYFNARIVAPLPEEWTVPASAIAKLGDFVAVYRLIEGKAVQTPVQLGHAAADRVQVKRWRKSASPEVWVPFDGTEPIAEKAAGLYDGASIEAP
jgi:multidrug efflux pump subunit AcrA (membrane-fusion protein)